ncbi:DUF2018 family protein [Arcobacteraceae bacterium]|nr:DUF2018 family protein [Arcobacteraceae bacterium]
MSKYDVLFEDEDDIFAGSPKSKFWDILNTANDELVKDQMDLLLEKFTVMETILLEQHGEDKLSQIIREYSFENSKEVEFNKKSAYLEFTGEVISRLDS